MVFVVGASCRISYSDISYLYVSFSGLIEERVIFSANFCLYYVVAFRRGFPFPLGA